MNKPYYQDDAVTIYHGDCREVAAEIDHKFDAVITDPPYGCTCNDWDNVLDFQSFWKVASAKPNGAICIMAQQPFATDLIVSNRKRFRYDLIWAKSRPVGFLNASRQPLRAHEHILIFYDKQPVFNPQMSKGEPYTKRHVTADRPGCYGDYQHAPVKISNGDRYPKSVIEVSNFNGCQFGFSKDRNQHPTQKPIELMTYLIATYTNACETILDPFAGSGTTGRAAKDLGRKATLIEREERYCEIAAKRMEQEVLPLEYK